MTLKIVKFVKISSLKKKTKKKQKKTKPTYTVVHKILIHCIKHGRYPQKLMSFFLFLFLLKFLYGVHFGCSHVWNFHAHGAPGHE